MTSWERIRDGLEELKFSLESAASPSAMRSGELSGAHAPPQPAPAPPKDRVGANSQPAARRAHRRPLADGEIDVHIRLPARYRPRLLARKKELGMSVSGIVADMVRRGLDEPPPGAPRLHRRDVRDGLVEEAVLAAVLGIEHARLVVEAALPEAQAFSETVRDAAAIAAEDRMAAARLALGRLDL